MADRGAMAFNVDDSLRYVVQDFASDLHLKVGSPPMARVHGSLAPIPGAPPLQPQDTMAPCARWSATARALKEFEEEGEADFSYSIQQVSRFRVNAFRQRGSISIVCRAIPFQVRTIDDLGLPDGDPQPGRGAAAESSCSPAPPARASRRRSRR